MYKFKLERDQQQTTSVTFSSCNPLITTEGNIVIVRCNRIHVIHSHHPQNSTYLPIKKCYFSFISIKIMNNKLYGQL
jgi:hypothetical protein